MVGHLHQRKSKQSSILWTARSIQGGQMAITPEEARMAHGNNLFLRAVRGNGYARESYTVQIRGVHGGYVSAWGRKEGDPDSANRNLGVMKLEDLFLCSAS